MSLVPCVTNASVSLSVAPTSGGSSGPSGPNINVSSITLPIYANGGANAQGVINMQSNFVIQDFTTSVGQDFFFGTGLPGNTLGLVGNYVSTANAFTVNGPGGDAANGSLNMLSSDDGRTAIWARGGAVASTLTILADPVVIPYNLNVSSINGAIPAFTSYTQQDVGALFSTLFAANPSLKTIVY